MQQASPLLIGKRKLLKRPLEIRWIDAHCLSYILINVTSKDWGENAFFMRPVHTISTGVQTLCAHSAECSLSAYHAPKLRPSHTATCVTRQPDPGTKLPLFPASQPRRARPSSTSLRKPKYIITSTVMSTSYLNAICSRGSLVRLPLSRLRLIKIISTDS